MELIDFYSNKSFQFIFKSDIVVEVKAPVV